MRSLVTLVIVGLFGLLAAASIGYAAYVVSRDSVGSPVTRVKLSPTDLAPVRQRRVSRPRTTTKAATTNRATTQQTTTVEAGDDHGGGDDDSSERGRGRNRGRGGGGGGDDD